MTNWFLYRQNNSGGSFHYDEASGISVNVWIEAPSTRAADTRAEDIGLYFDGYGDCDCCGSRWYRASYEEDESPPDENEPFLKDEMNSSFHRKWLDSYETFVHPLEGNFYGAHKDVVVTNRLVYGGENGYGVAVWKNAVKGPYEVSQKGWDETGNLDAPHPQADKYSLSSALRVFPSGVRFSYDDSYGYGRAWFEAIDDAQKFVDDVNHYLDVTPRPTVVNFVLGEDERMTGPL